MSTFHIVYVLGAAVIGLLTYRELIHWTRVGYHRIGNEAYFRLWLCIALFMLFWPIGALVLLSKRR